MVFIKLTQVLKNRKDQPVYVNLKDVSFIRETPEGTMIAFSGGGDSNYVTVSEDADEILNYLDNSPELVN